MQTEVNERYKCKLHIYKHKHGNKGLENKLNFDHLLYISRRDFEIHMAKTLARFIHVINKSLNSGFLKFPTLKLVKTQDKFKSHMT